MRGQYVQTRDCRRTDHLIDVLGVEPFLAVVIVDPQRKICVSEMIAFEPEALANPDLAAPELVAAAQAAAARVASGYRARRKSGSTQPVSKAYGGLRVLTGGTR